MDVSCTRCGTEYEFDDALISERGTNVRCTQCGYQFKVFPPKLATVGPDEWIVLTGLGRRIVYRSLRELQNGIVKGDVAREDLLARGSKPPRPLGSIAELDPLFVVKSAPERQPSTLTGVAPPKLPGAASIPARDAGPNFEDPSEPRTYSGVAPPPNVPVSNKPAAALPLAGRSGTVLGLGGIGFHGTKPNAAAPKATESDPPETRPFAIGPDTHPKLPAPPRVGEETAPLVEVHGVHAKPPPPVRAKTPEAVTAPIATAGISGATAATNAIATAASAATTASAARTATPVETDANPAPVGTSSKEDSHDAAPAKGTEGSAETQAPIGRTETPLARVQLQHKLVPVDASESAASRPLGDHTVKRPSTKTSVAPRSEPDASSTRLVDLPDQVAEKITHPTSPGVLSQAAPEGESKAAPEVANRLEVAPEGAAKAERDVVVPSEPLSSAPRQVAAVTSSKEPEHRVPRQESPKSKGQVRTEHAAASRPKIVAAQSAAAVPPRAEPGRIPWGRIAITIGLLVLSGYVGMRLVGAHLQSKKPRVAQGGVAQIRSTPNAWLPAVESSLERGDDQTARTLLSAVAPEERGSLTYRTMNARVTGEACDKIWWKLQLVGKGSGDTYAQSKQQLAECLERLNRAVAETKSDSEPSEVALAASLDARRMHGEKSEPTDARAIEQLRHPSSKALRYSSSILSWVKAGVPDESVVSSLREIRGAPVDLGSRSAALLVALVQLGRFSEARQELKGLQTQSPSHPLQGELTLYLDRAERAQAETPTDAAVGAAVATAALDAGKAAEPSDADDPDSDLYAGDFRLRLRRANECLSRNELTRAQKLLRSVLAQRPNDTEAITAVGDVHRRRGDLAQARQMYDKALSINGNYLPAMSGAAEVRWKSGDRAGAIPWFKRILERVGDTPGYGQTAAARIREFEGTAKEQP